eukprot:jgi/Antlo1/925/2440
MNEERPFSAINLMRACEYSSFRRSMDINNLFPRTNESRKGLFSATLI